METSEWIQNELKKLQKQTMHAYDRVLLLAAADLLMEQQKRIDQMEGELEGTLWSPRRWNDGF